MCIIYKNNDSSFKNNRLHLSEKEAEPYAVHYAGKNLVPKFKQCSYAQKQTMKLDVYILRIKIFRQENEIS